MSVPAVFVLSSVFDAAQIAGAGGLGTCAVIKRDAQTRGQRALSIARRGEDRAALKSVSSEVIPTADSISIIGMAGNR